MDIEKIRGALLSLSPAYISRIAKDARRFILENPGAADHSNFWKPRGAIGIGLSARQVAQVEYNIRKAK